MVLERSRPLLTTARLVVVLNYSLVLVSTGDTQRLLDFNPNDYSSTIE
jgi:hypothetical protein